MKISWKKLDRTSKDFGPPLALDNPIILIYLANSDLFSLYLSSNFLSFLALHQAIITETASFLSSFFCIILLSNSKAFYSASVNSDLTCNVYTNCETINIPQKQETTMINLPISVTGYKSPKPTVVIVTTTNQKLFQI